MLNSNKILTGVAYYMGDVLINIIFITWAHIEFNKSEIFWEELFGVPVTSFLTTYFSLPKLN